MRYATLLLSFLLFASFAFAQNATADFKYGIKLSNQSSWNYSRIRDSNGNVIGGGTVQLFHLQPGFLLKGSKGNFWDFSIQNINATFGSRAIASDPNSQLYNLSTNLKVGYFYTFFKQKTTHWAPMLGIEAAPYVGFARSRDTYSPLGTIASSTYFRTSSRFGTQILLAPRVLWCPGKRFFMDATLNMSLLRMGYSHFETNNPALSNLSRTRTSFQLDNNGVQLTLGFGLKL